MPQLRLPADTRVLTREFGDFRSSSVTVEAVSAAANPAGSVYNGAMLAVGFGEYSFLRFEMRSYINSEGKHYLFAQYLLNGNEIPVNFTNFDPVAHRWWRLRECDGYVEWSYSADRTEWTTLGFAYAFRPAGRVMAKSLSITLAHLGDRLTGPVVFDNLNIAPVDEADRTFPRQRTRNYMNVTSNWYSKDFDGRGVKVGICDQGTSKIVRQKLGATLLGKTLIDILNPGIETDVVPEGGSHGCLVAACNLPSGGVGVYDAIISGSSGYSYDSQMANGIAWCAERGAQVINLSFGSMWHPNFSGEPYPGVIGQALAYATEQQALVFISAGNSGQSFYWQEADVAIGKVPGTIRDDTEAWPTFPAFLSRTYANTHSVGAFDERTDKIAYFSNWGGPTYPMSGVTAGHLVRGMLPDGTEMTWSGTSAAAPHAGSIATRLLTGGKFTTAQVNTAMKNSRQRTSGPQVQEGSGKYDFDRALRILLSGAQTLEIADELENTTGAFDLEQELHGPVLEVDETYAVEVEDYVHYAVELDNARPILFNFGLRPAIELDAAFPVQVRTNRPTLSVAPIERGGARVIAQSMITGHFLHWDLPVHDLSIAETLSGPGAITGKLNPDVPDIRAVPLTPWGTWIHVEDEHGLIRASGILTTPFGVSGAERTLEAVGVSGWIHDITYDGAYAGTQVDPLTVVRGLWQHAQLNWPNGNLGVIVSSDTSQVRIGGAPPPASSNLSGPRIEVGEGPSTTTENGFETTEYKPYKLVWYEHIFIGSEIDKLASSTPFDYVERSAWKPDRSGVDHFIDLRWPRAGTRRSDLRFTDGENIKDSIPVNELDSSYVTDVRVFGAGEGQDIIFGQASTRAYPQVRRVVTLTEKTIKSAKRAKAVAEAELLRRTQPRGMEKILIDAGHENAPLGSFSVGDDIFIQTEVDWIGEVNMWHRILDFTYTPDEEAVSLTVAPSSSFRYGNDA